METKLILHRGYKGKYPENSLTSFHNAIKEALPTEIDIRITKDRVPVIIHDDNLDRLFDGSGKISDYTLSELKKFHYKEDPTQTIATLEEFCNAMQKEENKSIIFIHIKDLNDISEVINFLKKYNFNERIRFFAVDELIEPFRQLMRKNYPEYKIGLHFFENSPYYSESHFKLFDFIWADEINFKWIDKEKVELAHKLKKQFYAISPELIPESVFNGNIKERWKELLEAGVDGICTDKPEEFISFYTKHKPLYLT